MERIYSIEEAAKILQVTEETVRRYARSGKLKAAKMGKFYRITESDLKAFLDVQTKDSQDK